MHKNLLYNIIIVALIIFQTNVLGQAKSYFDTIFIENDTIIKEKKFKNNKLTCVRNFIKFPTYKEDYSFSDYKEMKKYFHGTYERYYDNGNLQCRSYYCKGKITKPDTTWHENGIISHIHIYNSNGNLEGRFSYFNDKKEIEMIKNYRDGKEYGGWIEYYTSEQREKQGLYQNGKKQGWWCKWFKDGTLKDSTFYNDGWIKESFIYYKNGKISTHTWVLTIESDTLPNDEHLLMLEDSYTIDGKLVSQVRNGNGYTHFFDLDGNYTSLMPYKNGKPAKLVSFLSEISKEKLIETKDPRYPPKKILKKKRFPFDVKKYGKLCVKGTD